jgi:ubiquinone/menaquinone biosynthesis C-methylase UbiE
MGLLMPNFLVPNFFILKLIKMKSYKNNASKKSADFVNPTYNSTSNVENELLINENKKWWESNPMRYDWNESVPHEEFSKPFYQAIDERFFAASANMFASNTTPFEELIDFKVLKDKSVLEIGVGNGSHAQLLANHCKDFTGIDLTDYGVHSSSKRMNVFNVENAKILQMNAEKMVFPNNKFDFVWSWGVIHHSANTANIVQEMHRILKSGGSSTVMVYHRGYFNYYFIGFLFHGILKGSIFKTLSLHKTMQEATDGAIARYYRPSELAKLLEQKGFVVDKMSVYGNKIELLPIPAGKFKSVLNKLLPDFIARFFTHYCRMGSMLVATFHKP